MQIGCEAYLHLLSSCYSKVQKRITSDISIYHHSDHKKKEQEQ
jgi:hypothetical protein